jgi:cation transport regulator ChaC
MSILMMLLLNYPNFTTVFPIPKERERKREQYLSSREWKKEQTHTERERQSSANQQTSVCFLSF